MGLIEPPFEDQPDAARSSQQQSHTKPPGLIKSGQRHNPQSRAFVVPHAVAVGGDDVEGVAARRQMREIGHAPIARLDPVSVPAFQPVLETDVLRFDEAQARVGDFQIVLARFNGDGLMKIERGAVERGALYDHRRRRGVERNRFWINYGHAIQRREPQAAIPRPERRRMPAAVAFRADHPIGFAVSYGVNPRNFAFGKFVELTAADALDALIAAHPEIAAPVFEDREDVVAEHPFLRREAGEEAIFEPVQTAVVSPDPQRAVVIFVNRPDAVARQPITLGVKAQPPVHVFGQPAVTADPHAAPPVFVNRLRRASQAVFGAEALLRAVLLAQQLVVETEPESAAPILKNGERRFVQPRRFVVREPFVLEANQPHIAAHQQTSRAVFIQGAYDGERLARRGHARQTIERIVSELAVLEPVDALIRNPDGARAVFDDGVKPLAHHSSFFGVSGDDLWGHAHQAIVGSPQPKNALAVFVDGPDVVAGKALRRGESSEPLVLESRQPAAARAEPESARAVFAERGDCRRRQPVFCGVNTNDLAFEHSQFAGPRGSDPETALPVFVKLVRIARRNLIGGQPAIADAPQLRATTAPDRARSSPVAGIRSKTIWIGRDGFESFILKTRQTLRRLRQQCAFRGQPDPANTVVR
ncbi:MAG: hypothetical protein JMDDDDMK_04034 [Acidobacteria bacterium]|nr:hypothetical protein [Acidobacteriota bacterium]